MLLAEGLHNHRGALLASFRAEYGLPLTGNGLTLTEMAAMAVWLPPGCAFWRSVGGPLAWSEETHLLNLVEFRLRVLYWVQTKDGGKGANQPELTKPPVFAGEVSADKARTDVRAAAWKRRQARKSDRVTT